MESAERSLSQAKASLLTTIIRRVLCEDSYVSFVTNGSLAREALMSLSKPQLMSLTRLLAKLLGETLSRLEDLERNANQEGKSDE